MFMKLITLNIWGGHVRDPLLDFVITHRQTDIFCFQEVYHNAPQKISDEDRYVSLNIFSELHSLLPDHEPFFRPVVGGIYGIGMFVKKGIQVLEEGEVAIYDNPTYRGLGPTHCRNLQWVKCQSNHKLYTIANVHGLWNGKGKTDAPERILQSEKIKAFLDTVQVPKVLCGDLNLRPDTESIKMVAQNMTNLIERFNVECTRTSLYPKAEKFADYVFISPEIFVNHFAVLQDEVSDHSPLLLDFV
jgi:endonuclease/exonuclease/phosphatase family metal-dependent hydrolase